MKNTLVVSAGVLKKLIASQIRNATTNSRPTTSMKPGRRAVRRESVVVDVSAAKGAEYREPDAIVQVAIQLSAHPRALCAGA